MAPTRAVVGLAALLGATAVEASPRFQVAQDQFDVDRAHSSIAFRIGFMGVTTVEGRFTDYSGTILYDEADLTRSSVSLVLKTASIFTASEQRDKHLRSPDFFDAERYPSVLFQSTVIEKGAAGYVVKGRLSLHGVTREVSLPVSRWHGRTRDMWDNTRIGVEGTVRLNRRDYGVVGPEVWNRLLEPGRLTLADEVDIDFRIQGRIYNMEKITLGEQSIASRMWKTIPAEGVAAAIEEYRRLKGAPGVEFDQWGLNALGYKLLQAGRTADAIEVLKLVAADHPDSAEAQDSLAEAYARAGEKDLALRHYRRSLELNPQNTSALEMLRRADAW